VAHFVARLFLALLLLLYGGVPILSAQSLSKADADFKSRCEAPGVVRCFGFDSNRDVAPHLEAAWDGMYRASVDPEVKASGSGSLRFIIPPHSPANTSGNFSFEFAENLSAQFGAGEEFYVQWRQRFSPEMLATAYEGGNGWKQVIIGEGSRPGHVAYSCTEIELVVEDTYQVGAPRMYHSCGGKDGHYESLEVFSPQVGTSLIQNAVGCPHNRVTSPPCLKYKPNEWMTFQVHVKVGTWYRNDKNYRHDSTVQLWVAEEGKHSKLAIDLNPSKGTGYDLVNTVPAARYGKIWLLPYNTAKDPGQEHPTAYTWYDELIVSKSRIPDPQ
jgi:hypothetical protein